MMHPAIPIVLISLLISLLEEDKKPPPEKSEPARENVVLLPDADGKTGALTVTTPSGAVVLESPYAGADVFERGRIERREEDAAAVQKRYAAALGARPPPPVSFTMYFIFGKEELTAESLAQFDRIKAELAVRPAPEVVVIGHTDRVGAVAFNDALSLKRAEVVRNALIGAGIGVGQISTAGRGEREPAVPTADEVSEPRNRRVEITVR
jgi:outer membrane protein OmpA-like peptidoglycan-associated protein